MAAAAAVAAAAGASQPQAGATAAAPTAAAEESSDSEPEQESGSPQKLIRKVSTSGQIRQKVRATRVGPGGGAEARVASPPPEASHPPFHSHSALARQKTRGLQPPSSVPPSSPHRRTAPQP